MSTPVFANYIAGEWIDSGNYIENRNPARTEEIVGLHPRGAAADMERAVAAASAALA